MTESEQHAVSCFSGLVIRHPSFQRAYNRILDVIEFNKINQAPEPQSVLILADSGCGKTTLFEDLQNNLPGRYEVQEGIDMVTKIPFSVAPFQPMQPPTPWPNNCLHQWALGIGTSMPPSSGSKTL